MGKMIIIIRMKNSGYVRVKIQINMGIILKYNRKGKDVGTKMNVRLWKQLKLLDHNNVSVEKMFEIKD